MEKGKALTNIYSLYDLAFAGLSNLKIIYSDNLENNYKELFSYIIIKKNAQILIKKSIKKYFIMKMMVVS